MAPFPGPCPPSRWFRGWLSVLRFGIWRQLPGTIVLIIGPAPAVETVKGSPGHFLPLWCKAESLSTLPDTKSTKHILDSTFRSLRVGEEKQKSFPSVGMENLNLNIVLGEKISSDLDGPPSCFGERNCARTRLMRSYTSCMRLDTRHVHNQLLDMKWTKRCRIVCQPGWDLSGGSSDGLIGTCWLSLTVLWQTPCSRWADR